MPSLCNSSSEAISLLFVLLRVSVLLKYMLSSVFMKYPIQSTAVTAIPLCICAIPFRLHSNYPPMSNLGYLHLEFIKLLFDNVSKIAYWLNLGEVVFLWEVLCMPYEQIIMKYLYYISNEMASKQAFTAKL